MPVSLTSAFLILSLDDIYNINNTYSVNIFKIIFCISNSLLGFLIFLINHFMSEIKYFSEISVTGMRIEKKRTHKYL
jgi:hypothetical protein